MDSYSAIGDSDKMFDDKAPLNIDNLTPRVSDEDMLKYTFAVLIEYDRAVSTGETPNIDPMNQQIVMQLDDGSAVAIPENIQRVAIMKYMELKNKNQPNQQNQVNQVNESQNSFSGSLVPKTRKGKIVTILAIVFLIIIIYALYRYINDEDVMVFNREYTF
ncbi:hypothetical protein BMW23_0241 [Bodo saltans virus]|uniref:Uncharacterized protein n=1 Tax=Bodo saltans virus TaxID=2024608 RepID=A0A2H4UTY5_9VIRU|nr:hypothetical protein QJ851_gp0236 [Bodo saltans virus]ATZ80299.1 hypothetical protein BMW23_0241 [Bodo saltans virus]